MVVNSGDIFLNATDVRNNARAFLIVHQEARAIENAILFAADSGLLTAYVYNTYMTQISIPSYIPISVPTIATGTVVNPIFVIGTAITINGIIVTLTGTTLAQTIIDINAANIKNITASISSGNQLSLTESSGGDIFALGVAATVAGLNATTIGSLDSLNNKIYLQNHGFRTGDQVILSSTNTFPTPFAGGVIYYILVVDSNNFKLCASYMDCINNNPIVLVDSGIGILSIRPFTSQENYFLAWQGQGDTDANRPLVDHMNGVINHFTNLGYTITRVQNANVQNASVFQWVIRW